MAKGAEPTLAEVLSAIKKISGKDALPEGVKAIDIPRIPLPATQLNLTFTGGGFPQGRMVEYFGPESSGKSTTALITAVGFQKADKRPIFIVDAEGTYDPLWAEKLGIDNKRVILWRPDASTAEEIFEKCLDILSTGEVSLLIIDSIPALVPQNVEEKDMTQLTMAGISKPLSTFSQKAVKILLKKPDVSLIGLNQVRDNMSAYGDPMQTPGGHAWRHFCSCRLQFKSDPIDENGNILSDRSDKATGVRINIFLKKNKTGPRDWKNTSYSVNFITGFDPVLDLVDTGRMLGLIKLGGAKYSYTDKEGEIYSAIGKRAFIEQMPDNIKESITQDILHYTASPQ
jgi:recombination protein RecA